MADVCRAVKSPRGALCAEREGSGFFSAVLANIAFAAGARLVSGIIKDERALRACLIHLWRRIIRIISRFK